jgi:predicted SAM-dependent methyltransferase
MAQKLNLGAGDSKIPGFTSVDLYDEKADVKADICDLPFEDNSVDEIVAYQVVEHIPYQKSQKMFEEMYRVLRLGGTATIETPDIDYIAADILKNGLTDIWIHSLVGEYYRPWDKDRYDDWENCAAAIHRNPWNFRRIQEICEPLGFKVERTVPTQIIVKENMAVVLTK